MKKVLFLFILLLSTTSHGQDLSIFKVDVSAFPNVKAYFFAFDAAWKQQTPDKTEMIMKENGLARTVLNVTCFTPSKAKSISSVLAIDVSGSMTGKNMDIVKTAATTWVNALSMDTNECAITTFNHYNYFNQDFSTDKNKLLTAIGNLSPSGGTDYNKALICQMASGLQATKTGKYQKILVFISDGLSKSVTEISKIVDEAKVQQCKIFVVAVDMKCPQDLKEIATQTGGHWFENLNDLTKAEELFRKILYIAQGGEPCSILWRSVANCDTADVNLELIWKGLTSTLLYPTPSTVVHKLEVKPSRIGFKSLRAGLTKDTIINLKAVGVDIKITAINLKYGSLRSPYKTLHFQ